MSGEATYHYYSQNMPKKPPNRVVSLVPSVTETLFDLGVGDRVVGVTDDCLFPEVGLQGKVRLGPMDAVRVSDVAGLYPDVVIVNREENSSKDIYALEAAGLNVWKTFPRTVMEAMNLIWDLLHLFMVTDRLLYERVNLINRTIDWVSGVTETHEDTVCKVFMPLLLEPLTTVGPDTYAHDLLRVAGGTNIFGDRLPRGESPDPAEDLSRYPGVSVAEVEAAQPEIVLLPTHPLGFVEEDVAWFAGLNIPAAKTQQIYLIDGTLLTYHGTRLARALNEISALMCAAEGS